ncbi:hypothetical protein Tco_0167457 [Tanacetum coccineum]
MTSSSSPPPSLLPSSSCKRSRSPSPSLASSVSPSTPTTVVPPTPEHVESVGDNIETLRASLASAIQETMTLRARDHTVITSSRVLREFRVNDKYEIQEFRSRAEYVESCFEQSHNRQIRDRALTQRTDMTKQDIEASRARAEAAEQRAETLQVSLRSAQIDVRDLIESREADRYEMVELRSRA